MTLSCWKIVSRVSENGNRAVRSNSLPPPPYNTFPLLTKLVLIASQKGLHGKPSQSHPTFKQTLNDGKDSFRHIVQCGLLWLSI